METNTHAGVAVTHLSKDFGALRAVDDLSFEVGRGEVVGFLGPNGAGKSTTMKMVCGYLSPSAGGVEVCGLDLAAQPLEVKRRIGYLPEGAPLYGDMTTRRFLDFIAALRGYDGAQRRERVGAVAERIELGSVLDQPIEQLSKGFKRRVGLAQAILHDPPVLVLDEPTDGLDPNQKYEVRRLIAGIAADKAILISTHILEEVEAVCTRALVIAHGRLLADARPGELASRGSTHNAVLLTLPESASRMTAQLGAMPEVARVESLPAAAGQVCMRLYATRGQSIVYAVQAALAAAQVVATELTVEPGRLDEVFRTLTRQVDGRETRS